MLGTYWEMKGGTTVNEATIQTKFRKAVKQSGGKAIFDLRHTKGNQAKAQKIVLWLFAKTRGMRRIIIILDNDSLLDILK